MPLLSADFYARRAMESRRLAERSTDDGDRAIYDRVATDYERLANRRTWALGKLDDRSDRQSRS